MEFHKIAVIVIAILFIGIVIVIFKSLEHTISNLRVKLKQVEDSNEILRKNQRQYINDKLTSDKELTAAKNKYTILLRHLKRLVDNPVSCLKVVNKEVGDKFITPALRFTAKGENINYTAFMYQGGEDVTDRVVIALSVEETLEDVIESL